MKREIKPKNTEKTNKFGKKIVLWRQIVQVYVPFNKSLGSISISEWSYVKQMC